MRSKGQTSMYLPCFLRGWAFRGQLCPGQESMTNNMSCVACLGIYQGIREE